MFLLLKIGAGSIQLCVRYMVFELSDRHACLEPAQIKVSTSLRDYISAMVLHLVNLSWRAASQLRHDEPRDNHCDRTCDTKTTIHYRQQARVKSS